MGLILKTDDRVIALAGNPNVGKSTLFNALTGMRQHTGNWPGKTVEVAQGRFGYKGEEYLLIDLPGTYSLQARSEEERVAASFLQSQQADCAIVVCDATCLERNLLLALQVMELCETVIVCVNLLDEAEKKEIEIDLAALERLLGVPVVGIAAGRRDGIDRLMERVRRVIDGFERPHPILTQDTKPHAHVKRAEQIGKLVVRQTAQNAVCARERRLDRVLTGKWTGLPLLLLLLLAVFYLTIRGANVPSALLERFFLWFGDLLHRGAAAIGLPWYLTQPLLDGVYLTAAKVISVMLPPILIFFPLFTLLEEVGYLPRLAFLLDSGFARCGACGKQALTTCMGFGCNAAGVVGCRIIDSPRERLIAIMTNSFVPCNGRFPGLIALAALLAGSSWKSTLLVTVCVIFGVCMSMAMSWFLSKTLLQGVPSSFALELPPFRKPNLRHVLVRALLDRALSVLGRAAAVAAPAGLILWCLTNIHVGGSSLLLHAAAFLHPLGTWMGMSGAILLAFVLAFPANELVLPAIIMILTGGTNLAQEAAALAQFGWSTQMLLCMMVFFLFHWPCSTTILSIHHETRSVKWTLMAFILPTVTGILLCGVLNMIL